MKIKTAEFFMQMYLKFFKYACSLTCTEQVQIPWFTLEVKKHTPRPICQCL